MKDFGGEKRMIRNIVNFTITITVMMSISISSLAYAQTAPVVTILSPSAILEPSMNKPSDKDGFPPTHSSADPEEGLLGAKVEVITPIFKPTVNLIDDNFDSVDDLSVDVEERDIDYLVQLELHGRTAYPLLMAQLLLMK